MMRRAGIINFASVTQIEWSNVIDGKPSADRALEAATRNSNTCRRFAGQAVRYLPQGDRTAAHRRSFAQGDGRTPGVSENDVKNYLVRGLRKIMQTMARGAGCAWTMTTDERHTTRRWK